MSIDTVLSMFTDLQQRHTLKKCVAFTQLLITTIAVQKAEPASEMGILQSLLATYDQDTLAHAQRVLFLAEVVAHKLHLSEEDVVLTCLAALLHDVGKAGIPETILNKPGPLDEHEHAVMCRHSEIGQQMLVQAGSIFVQVAPLVMAHHERWDGAGYPGRLVGEEIPFAARIIAVVDAYDAMRQRRVYQEQRPVVEVRAELQRCAGSQFDPRIVGVFLSLLDEFGRRQEHARRNRVAGEAELVGVMYAVPSLQFGECAPVSA